MTTEMRKSNATDIDKSKKQPKNASTQPQVKFKPKRKKTSSYYNITNKTKLGCLIAVVGIVIAHVASRYFSNLASVGKFSSKQPYRFKRTPAPEFDISRGIERRSNLSLEEFIQLYDAKWPVLITDAMKDWPAMEKWSKRFFMQNYGSEIVSFKGVHGTLDKREGLAAPLRVFLQHVHESSRYSWSYVNDEVFIVRNPDLRNDIRTPIYLKEDFFSLLPESIRPWNAMLLWGPKYSRSTLHIDPYNWTGTNAVIKGRKLWKMYPPGQDHLLYVPAGRKSGFPLDCLKYQSDADAYDYNAKKYPLLKKARAIEFEQRAGEMLIIPTGWFHQVFNDEETLAISSQIMNSQNHREVLEEIIKGQNVKKEDISADFDSFSPKEKVEHIISLFPKSVIEHGRLVHKDIMDQLDGIK
eukprot:gene16764-18458_t